MDQTKRPLAMHQTQQQITLNKGRETFVFRYEQGHEEDLLDALIDHARDKRIDFDWFDAAVVSFQLTQSLLAQAQRLANDD